MPSPSDAALASCLDALSNPTRIEVMRLLRTPKSLREIEVRNEEEGAPLSRQGVRRHLDQLIEAGVVATRQGIREYGEATEFVVNHQRVYAASEELRNLARLRPVVEPEGETIQAGGESPLRRVGAMLILVKGLDEGATFDLRPQGGKGDWIVGRSRTVAVPLDFDPTISSENATIQFRDGKHLLADVAGSRNGTTHNLRRLREGEWVALQHGDLVGVGRSLLLYWA